MPTLELNLRPIANADMAFLRELYSTTRADEMASTGWSQPAIDAFLAQQFDAQHRYYQEHYHDAQFSLICHRSQAIGRLYVFRGPNTLNLIDIALLPDWRGQGIGTRYLQALTKEADETGKAIRLFVEPGNPATRLYSRFGFVVTGNNRVYLQMQRSARTSLAQEASA
ncbi:GNAT family N-acetyltransferase [Pseudomonas sp. JS3066]|uniref:GNAT family N-acetyltransferase n=1 Tax=Pseudomonas sp. JS3066 TaxID=3090665 RepID=UPI002E7B310C|nr:GNAT family N-acetyltransferase [Pseudomonas sp. JS3066]WVK94659.1 GNAT family N-acetyltransferase [Pseudomonas sp. JS3066]